jgi:DNA-directed RNA polymerase subunit M/transcription elongation factor TFIIS
MKKTMTARTACPARESWLAHLKGSLPGTLRTSNLADHLETCSRCQATVEDLCEGSKTWVEVTSGWRQLGLELPPADQGLQVPVPPGKLEANATIVGERVSPDKTVLPPLVAQIETDLPNRLIVYTCPRCNAMISVHRDQTGTKHNCQSCGQRLEVPNDGVGEVQVVRVNSGFNEVQMVKESEPGSLSAKPGIKATVLGRVVPENKSIEVPHDVIRLAYIVGAIIPVIGWIMAIYLLVKNKARHAMGVGAISILTSCGWVGLVNTILYRGSQNSVLRPQGAGPTVLAQLAAPQSDAPTPIQQRNKLVGVWKESRTLWSVVDPVTKEILTGYETTTKEYKTNGTYAEVSRAHDNKNPDVIINDSGSYSYENGVLTISGQIGRGSMFITWVGNDQHSLTVGALTIVFNRVR